MGTRVDFYVGRGETAEWLGSYPWDGYPDGVFGEVGVRARLFAEPPPTEEEYRHWVTDFLTSSENAGRSTLPEHGWPWPWDDSRTTDYAYAWEAGVIYGSCFGHSWFRVDPTAPRWGEQSREDEDGNYVAVPKDAVFPDMTSRRAVTFGPRSGLIVIGLPASEES